MCVSEHLVFLFRNITGDFYFKISNVGYKTKIVCTMWRFKINHTKPIHTIFTLIKLVTFMVPSQNFSICNCKIS